MPQCHRYISNLNEKEYYGVLLFYAFYLKTTKAFANLDYVSPCYSL